MRSLNNKTCCEDFKLANITFNEEKPTYNHTVMFLSHTFNPGLITQDNVINKYKSITLDKLIEYSHVYDFNLIRAILSSVKNNSFNNRFLSMILDVNTMT